MIGAWRDSGVWRWMRRRGDAGDGRAAFLARASQALASSLDYETTLATMAKLAIPGFADWSAVHLGDATHVQRVAVAHRDPALEGVLRSWQRSRPFRTDVARGVPEVIRTGRPLFLPIVEPAALREIASLPGAVEMFTRVGCASLIIVPLDVDGRTLGTLMFVRGAARRPFAQADLTLAETLGRQAALAVDHAVLYAALARRERLYHLTFEQAPVGIAHVALDGRLLDVNDRLALLLGRPRGALLALQVSSLRHPDDQRRDEEARERLLEGERDRVTFEGAYLRGDGGRLSASVTMALVRDADGQPLHFLAAVEDLSALRRVEAELQVSEDRLRLALHAVGVGIWERDLRSGRVVWTVCGSCADTMPAATFRSDREALLALVHAGDRRRVADGIRQAIEGGQPFDLTFRVMASDGGLRWMQTRGRALCDASGTPERVFGVAIDVTDRKDLEQQFNHAQKMEAVGRLAGGIAHDFNNLLAAIMGYSDVVLEELPPGSPVCEDVREIYRAAERAARLTRQLLAFSRKEAVQPQVLHVNRALEAVGALVTRLVGEDVIVAMHPGDFADCVRIDPGQFEQVVMNLVVNARDAMPGGGRLTIESAVETTGSGHDASPGRAVRLSVTDTGTGMDEATRRKIFEPFFTTKGASGTGLGLSTVYGIVDQSGGTIAVTSEPGRGTTFTIRLPAVAPTEQPGQQEGDGLCVNSPAA